MEVPFANPKPWDTGAVIDLMNVLGGFKSYSKCSYWADVLDLEHKPVGSGADVYEQWKAKDYAAIHEHLLEDVRCEFDMYKRCAGLI